MPTLLTRTVTIALTDEDYAAIEKRARGCTPTEKAREILLKALHADPFEVAVLGELLTVRRLAVNGPSKLKEMQADQARDARRILGYDTTEGA